MTGDETRPWELILRLLGAIAAGIGVLGFATLAGGTILFFRFEGAGLPTEHAIAVVPKADLLVLGASVLFPLVGVPLTKLSRGAK